MVGRKWKFGGGGSLLRGEIFLVGGWANFWLLWWGDSPHPPQFRKSWQVVLIYNYIAYMKQWPSGQGAEFPIQGSHVQNHWVVPRSTQPFIVPRSIKWVPGISGNYLVVKCKKLSPQTGSSLEAVEPIHKKEP